MFLLVPKIAAKCSLLRWI